MRLQNMKSSETTEQIKLFNWAKRNEEFIPELKMMFHVPNEGKREQSTGSVMKAAGLKSGVPDICLPVARKGYHALYIELKYGRNRTTREQDDMITELRAAGNAVHVCYGFESAREVIRHYLARAEGFDLVNCEEAPKIFDRCDGFQEWEQAPCSRCHFYAHFRSGGNIGHENHRGTE